MNRNQYCCVRQFNGSSSDVELKFFRFPSVKSTVLYGLSLIGEGINCFVLCLYFDFKSLLRKGLF
jgi:hypothetical protein